MYQRHLLLPKVYSMFASLLVVVQVSEPQSHTARLILDLYLSEMASDVHMGWKALKACLALFLRIGYTVADSRKQTLRLLVSWLKAYITLITYCCSHMMLFIYVAFAIWNLAFQTAFLKTSVSCPSIGSDMAWWGWLSLNNPTAGVRIWVVLVWGIWIFLLSNPTVDKIWVSNPVADGWWTRRSHVQDEFNHWQLQIEKCRLKVCCQGSVNSYRPSPPPISSSAVLWVIAWVR